VEVITPRDEDNVFPGERELRTKVTTSATRPKDCDPHLPTFR
jgi:hypothetical protein